MHIPCRHRNILKRCWHIVAMINANDSAALYKQFGQVGHIIGRALESHNDIVSLQIICSLLQDLLTKLRTGLFASLRGGHV